MIQTTADRVSGYRITSSLGVMTAAALLPSAALTAYGEGMQEDIEAAGAELNRTMGLSRQMALAQLDQEAQHRGANAVIGIRLQTATDAKGLWLVFTGTAVRIEPDKK